MKSKQELLKQKQMLELALQDVEDKLQAFDSTLHLYDASRPFCKWKLEEQNNLYLINADAYEWFVQEENSDKTITDYNNCRRSVAFDSVVQ